MKKRTQHCLATLCKSVFLSCTYNSKLCERRQSCMQFRWEPCDLSRSHGRQLSVIGIISSNPIHPTWYDWLVLNMKGSVIKFGIQQYLWYKCTALIKCFSSQLEQSKHLIPRLSIHPDLKAECHLFYQKWILFTHCTCQCYSIGSNSVSWQSTWQRWGTTGPLRYWKWFSGWLKLSSNQINHRADQAMQDRHRNSVKNPTFKSKIPCAMLPTIYHIEAAIKMKKKPFNYRAYLPDAITPQRNKKNKDKTKWRKPCRQTALLLKHSWWDMMPCGGWNKTLSQSVHCLCAMLNQSIGVCPHTDIVTIITHCALVPCREPPSGPWDSFCIEGKSYTWQYLWHFNNVTKHYSFI